MVDTGSGVEGFVACRRARTMTALYLVQGGA